MTDDQLERALTAAERRRLHELFERGQRALTDGQAGKAAILLLDCVVEDPGNVLYVATFLECLKHDMPVATIRQRLTLMRCEWKLRRAVAVGDHKAVLQSGPHLVIHRPTDPFLLGKLAEACCHFRFREAELVWLRWAVASNAENVELLRQAARSLARKGRFDDSTALWNRVREIMPQDVEANRAIGEWQMPSHELSDAGCRELHEAKQRIEQDPASVDGYLKVAAIHEQRNELDLAEQSLRQAIAVSPGNLTTAERLEDLQLAQIRRQLRFAQGLAACDPHPEAAELIAGLTAELHQRELEVYDARSQRRPDDDRLKLFVGNGLRHVGRFREAIRRFQDVRAQSDERPAALLAMGECLQHLRQFLPALDAYRESAEMARLAGQKELASQAQARAVALGRALDPPETALESLVDGSDSANDG